MGGRIGPKKKPRLEPEVQEPEVQEPKVQEPKVPEVQEVKKGRRGRKKSLSPSTSSSGPPPNISYEPEDLTPANFDANLGPNDEFSPLRKIQGKSWIDEYLTYTADHESPEIFHKWVALGVLSAAVRRQIHMDRGFYTLYPNLYIVLVAGSAVCRKSVAVGLGKKVLKNLQAMVKKTSTFIEDKLTPEALIDALAGPPEANELTGQVNQISAGTIISDELSVFLGPASYAMSTIALLTNLFDCPSNWTYRTVTRGKIEINNVYVTMISASTPEWLKSSIPSDAVGGGLLSRLILVYADKPRKFNPNPAVTDAMISSARRLLADLVTITKIKGPMVLTDDAKKWYDSWYREQMALLIASDVGELYVRRTDALLKVAMLLSVAKRSNRLITTKELIEAKAFLDEINVGTQRAVSQVVTSNEGDPAARILAVLYRRPKITHSELLKYVWRYMSAETVAKVMDTLAQAGIITSGISDGKEVYYMLKLEKALDEVKQLSL